ncbi:efflux RND transporter periplasmic adaptor subunit [Povalibacter sp.]|uniref:efflux RND transporter periplasmic adaptor subunit n=1 Tax=Povalibacter sp. TaxID=1962978 RepID=UPI002F3E50DF
MKKILVAGAVVAAIVTGVLLWSTKSEHSTNPSSRASVATAAVVRTALASEEALDIVVESTGTVRANEAIEITSQVAALVTAIRFKEGARIARGDVLLELDGAQPRAAMAEAEAALANSRSMYQRSVDLAAAAAVSKAQLQQLEADLLRDEARLAAARARLAETVIRAPFSGQVGLRRISLGAFVSPGTLITTLDDLSEVKVDFAVPEPTLPILRQGLPVVATTPVYPGRVFTGKIDSVDPRIDPNTRAVQVRARFSNANGELTPGMFVAASLVRERQTTIVVPEGAVLPEQSKQYIFIVENDKAVRREVEVGHRVPGRVQILSGLIPGERIVVDGALKLREGMTVSDATPATVAAGSGS